MHILARFLQYRWRFVVGALIVTLFVFFFIEEDAFSANWFNDHWGYRTKLTFGNTGSAQSNKKVKFDIDTASLISVGTMQSDCDDVRFTDINGKVLRYYLDAASGACNTSSTDYYVLVPIITTDTNVIYLYYGNANASAAGESSQFSEGTFSPTSGPDVGDEEKSPGPVIHLRFDEGADNTCPSGADYCDSSGYGNDGQNTTGFDRKKTGECLSGGCIDSEAGAIDFVTVPDNDNLDFGTSSFTVSGWALHRDYTYPKGNFMIKKSAICFNDGAANAGWDIGHGYHTNALNICLRDTSNNYVQSNLVFDSGYHPSQLIGQWVYYTIVFDRTNNVVQAYVNGQKQANELDISSITGSLSNSSDVLIGSMYGWETDGRIDDVKMYPYARSAAEVLGDYNARGQSNTGGAIFGSKDVLSISDGLVGYWPLDEVTENTCTGGVNDACDASGNSHDGAWDGDTASDLGVFGSGVTFDGTGDGLTVASSSLLQLGDGNATISMWIYPDSFGSYKTVFDKGTVGTAREYSFFMHSTTTGWIAFGHDGTSGVATSFDIPFTTEEWQLLTIVRDGAEVKIYRNGELTETVVQSGTITNTDALSIGVNTSTGGTDWDGKIDEVRLYSKALSGLDVQALYNWAPGPVLYLPFDENGGTTTVFDRSGNENNGTLNGSMTNDDWVRGKYGSALTFDASDDFVEVANTPELNPLAFTASVWAKSNQSTWNDSGFFMSKRQMFVMHPNQSQTTVNFYIYLDPTGWTSVYCTPPGSITDWHYYTMTWDGEDLRCYVNGQQGASSTFTGPISTSDTGVLTIGRDDGLSRYFDGVLDEVRFYNYARTPGQIIEDMNGGHPVGGSPVGSQIGYWGFDEGYGSTAHDQLETTDLTLTCTGTLCVDPIWSSDAVSGKSLYFSNDTAEFGGSATGSILNIPNEADAAVTVSIWAKPAVPRYVFQDMFTLIRNGASIDENYGLFVNSTNDLRWNIYSSGSFYTCDSTDPLVLDNEWAHYAAVFVQGQDVTFYRNGKKMETVSCPYVSELASTSFNIGGHQGAHQGFVGWLDEAKVYNAALTDAEIVLDYNLGASANFSTGALEEIQDTSVYSHWKLDETTGTTAKDSVAGNDGTMTSFNTGGFVKDGYINGGVEAVNNDFSFIAISPFKSSVDAFTLEAWVYNTSLDGDNDTIAATDSWRFQALDSGGSLYYSIDWSGYSSISQLASYDVWNHVVFTWDGSASQIYINGFAGSTDSQGSSPLSITAARLLADGVSGIGSIDYWEAGKVDEIRFYDYALSPEQIRAAHARTQKNQEVSGAPVGYWNFNENGGTSTVYDHSRLQNDGTMNGSMTDADWVRGPKGFGSALDFDGTDDYIDSNATAADLGFADATESFSISVWTKTTGTGEYYLFDNWDISPAVNVSLRLDNGAVETYISDATYSNGTPQFGSGYNDGKWHNIVVTWDGAGTESVYVDGLYLGGTSTPLLTGNLDSGSNFWFAQRPSAVAYFPGQLDEVKVYDYALTPGQVAYGYNRAAPVGHWQFDECSGATAYDNSGRGNHGTITIGATGSNTSLGTCNSGTSTESWENGTNGRWNSGIDFDGTDDYVTMGDPSDGSLDFGTGDFTIAYWANYTSVGANGFRQVAKRPGAVGAGWSVGSDGTGVAFRLDDGSSAIEPGIGSTDYTGAWHHFVFVFDRDVLLYVYVDGSLIGTYDISSINGSVSNGSQFNINTFENLTNVSKADILMDDVRAYNYALSEEQIRTVYSGGASVSFR